jgi:hypothetical protein
MLLPPKVRRREMDRNLVVFFSDHRERAFRRAISDFCNYYGVKRPRIEWYQYIDWGKTAGRTFEDGRIYLVHPENWKRNRVYKSERMWVQTVYHELGHYLFWTDAERKAETFTKRMVRGLRRSARTRLSARPTSSTSPSRIARSASRSSRTPLRTDATGGMRGRRSSVSGSRRNFRRPAAIRA